MRLLVVAMSYGTNDVHYWTEIGSFVNDNGLAEAYRQRVELNHPPLAALLSSVLWTASTVGLPFRWLIKVPGVVGDAIAARALFVVSSRLRGAEWGLRVVALYLWSPATILLSSFHGNTDSLYAGLLMAAIAAAVASRPGLSGLAMAAAGSVKLLPSLAMPALGVAFAQPRRFVRFAIGCSLGLVPFAPLMILEPTQFIHRVFGYTPSPNRWGISWLLSMATAGFDASVPTGASASWYVANGRYVVGIMAVVTPAIMLRRTTDPLILVSAATASYFVFTPGMGVQHLALLLPLSAAHGIAAGVWIHTATGAFLSAVYVSTLASLSPVVSAINGAWPLPAALFGLVLWVVLAGGWTRQMSKSAPDTAD